MNEEKSPGPRYLSLRDLIFGAFFCAIGGVDLFNGNLNFGVGFVALGLALIVGSPQMHEWLDVDVKRPLTPLKIISYLLGVAALILFAVQLWGRWAG